MPINKLHDEFKTLDMSTGWEVPPGYPEGIKQKILSGALDEEGRRGSRSRLLKFDPKFLRLRQVFVLQGETHPNSVTGEALRQGARNFLKVRCMLFSYNFGRHAQIATKDFQIALQGRAFYPFDVLDGRLRADMIGQ